MLPPQSRKPGRPKNPDLESWRKADILSASARIFANRGYAETDVQEIADALGIGKATVYRYFPTKQELFLATVDSGLEDLSAQIDALFEQGHRDPLDLVRDAVVTYLKFFQARPELAELFIQERAVFRDRHTPLYFAEKYKKHDRDVPFINALIRLGRFRKVPADRVLDVVCDLLYGTVLSNHLSGRSATPTKQAAAILDVLFHGLLSDSERRRIARRRRSHVVTAMLLCLMLIGCGNSSGSAIADRETVAVTVEPIATRSLKQTVSAVGTLNGFEEVTLAPKVDGRIVAIRADVGDRVTPGTVLLELDPRDYDLAVAEATQALAVELAKLGLEKLPSDSFDVSQVPVVQRAAASLEDASRRWKQKRDLKKDNAASPDEVDLLETEWKIAEATKNHVATEAQATLAAARLRKATLDAALQRRADCLLTAPTPSSGMLRESVPKLQYAVAQRMVSEGEMIRANPVTNAFKLVLDFKMKLRVMVAERYVSEVSVGQPVEVTTDAWPGRVFVGTVARVNPTIDPLNRTFAVEVEIANNDGALKCGGFAKAMIRTREDESVRTVPPTAIVSFAGVHKVFVMVGDQATAVEVTTGSRDRDWVEVRGSFPANAPVITSGLTRIVDGTPVRLREAP